MRSLFNFYLPVLLLAAVTGSGCRPAPEEKSIPDYVAALDKGEYLTRVSAAKALSEKAGPEDGAALPALIRALKDPNESVRLYSIKALGNIGDPAALPALVESARDPSSYVRYEAVGVLGLFSDPRAINALRKALGDESSHVRYAACKSLGDLEAQDALHHLVFALKDESTYVRSAASLALGKLGDTSVIPLLQKSLADPNEWVRNSAGRALHGLGSTSGIPVLIENLSSETADKGGTVRKQAVEFLRQISGQNFGFDPDAPDPQRQAAVSRWEDWAEKQRPAVTPLTRSEEESAP